MVVRYVHIIWSFFMDVFSRLLGRENAVVWMNGYFLVVRSFYFLGATTGVVVFVEVACLFAVSFADGLLTNA